MPSDPSQNPLQQRFSCSMSYPPLLPDHAYKDRDPPDHAYEDRQFDRRQLDWEQDTHCMTSQQSYAEARQRSNCNDIILCPCSLCHHDLKCFHLSHCRSCLQVHAKAIMAPSSLVDRAENQHIPSKTHGACSAQAKCQHIELGYTACLTFIYVQ